MTAACSRAGLSREVLPKALEYQRLLSAKQASLGVSLNYSCVICLHLSATESGKSVDVKHLVKIAGAKSKPHYLQTYQNAEKVLDIKQASKPSNKNQNPLHSLDPTSSIFIFSTCPSKRSVYSLACPRCRSWQPTSSPPMTAISGRV